MVWGVITVGLRLGFDLMYLGLVRVRGGDLGWLGFKRFKGPVIASLARQQCLLRCDMFSLQQFGSIQQF